MNKRNEITKIECEFCQKEYKTISSLNHHMKTAQFCLKIQNKEIIIKEYKCEFCNYIFKNKRNLQTHITICKHKSIFERENKIKEKHEQEIRLIKEKYEQEINDQKIYIASLEAKIEIYEKDQNVISDIAKQTKITNTSNIINNLAVYDIDKITENFSNKLEYMTKEDIMNGQKGIANMLAPCLYDQNGNKMITCSDKARLVFTKIDQNNNRTKDIELKNLVSVIKPLALQKADKIVDKHNRLKENIYTIENLKCENKEYEKYIQNFQEIIDDYKKSNTHNKLIADYEKKIKEYQKNIQKNEDIIYSLKMDKLDYDIHEKEKDEDVECYTEEINILNIEDFDNENEKLLDGHTEIKYLDKEPTKFARQISKIL